MYFFFFFFLMFKIRNFFSFVFYPLRNVDLFLQPISLKHENKSKRSNGLGRMLSLFVFIFLFYNFITSDMIQKKNPKVLQQINESRIRPEIRLEKQEEFFFGYEKSILNSSFVLNYCLT